MPQGQSCLTVDFRFLSEEFAEFVGGDVNDAFVAELDDNELSGDGNAVNAPGNFAFDGGGNLISVNTANVQRGRGRGDHLRRGDSAPPCVDADHARSALGLPVDLRPGRLGLRLGGVPRRAAAGQAATCQPGAVVVDVTPPAVTLTSPGNGSTITAAPVYSGRGGRTGSQVTVQTFAGAAASGAAVQSLTATPAGGALVGGRAARCAPGTYTAVASQADAAGNVGSARRSRSPWRTPPPPVDEGPPPPVTGKAVNVAVVKGKVRIRRPGGKFVLTSTTLRRSRRARPSTRARAPSRSPRRARAASCRRPTSSTASSRSRRPAGKKPITNLKLNEKLAKCPTKKGSKKAKSSAKKKRKRRLWGDGKGNFRTSGRRSAATVSGTKWLVEDTCAGTLTRVARGKVKVRDFRKKKTITVKAGKRYMAR